MHITQKFAAVLAVSALALAGCSNDTANTPAEQTSGAQQNTESQNPNAKTAALGERVETSIQEENDIFMTVNSIDRARECKYGVNAYATPPQVGEDQEILQISGIFEVERYDGPMSKVLPAIPGTPKVETSDGFTQESTTLFDCSAPNDGQQNWATPTPVGSKVKIFGEFLVPKGVNVVIIDGVRFPVQ